MKFLYLDKKDRIVAWFTPTRTAVSAAGLAILLALPLWHESVSGTFLLEPVKSAVVRAHVPGSVAQIDVREGQNVTKDEPLAALSNIPLQSEYEDLRAKLALASDRTNMAHLRYADYGTALKEQEQLAAQVQQAGENYSELELKSPISGTVLTPKVQDLLGSYLKEGSPVLEIADLSAMHARIYISEFDLSKVTISAPARIQLNGELEKWEGLTTGIASRPTEMDPQLVSTEQLSGMVQPHFYLVEIVVQNPGNRLRPGMSGVARIYGKRRSVAGMGWEAISDFWSRKLW